MSNQAEPVPGPELDPEDLKIEAENIEQVGNLIDAYTALDVHPESGRVTEINTDLKTALGNFVQHYLQRIQSHQHIETILKAALIERLPEADFEQIEKLLNTVMRNSNNAIEKIMAPFVAEKNMGGEGGNTTFMFDMSQKDAPVEEKILKDDRMTSEMIKGLYDLAQMMNAIASPKGKK